MKALVTIVRRDLLLAMRRKAEILTALFFFVIVTSLFPLGIGAEPALLRKIAPGVLWVGALLATMLGLQRMYAADHADGTLEQMLLSPSALPLLVLGKNIAHWIVCGLPLVVLAPILGVQYDLRGEPLCVLTIGLLIGTPILSVIGSIGAALTLGVRGGGPLLSLLVLPLYIPALIFGAGAVHAQIGGTGAEGHLSLLGALFATSLFFAPWASTAALRIALE
ncbi:heme exporter protein CcmB [Ramlibacter albus]|uniref:Heme exporter protein B n=1 Tax=Ramlibacter albus TaxID=2079448 RepID=A0A923M5B2_9BURK|nr:heme exporter protein CcmB [Ramlibacter albus]MBC5764472.1 heme exporter protein CcmB [Ramlibacter albus]